MSNKPAPYNQPDVLKVIQKWWDKSYPTGQAIPPKQTGAGAIYNLYLEYTNTTGQQVWEPSYLTANQFAKCLVALQICEVDGVFRVLPHWEPKEYEIRRAKVY